MGMDYGMVKAMAPASMKKPGKPAKAAAARKVAKPKKARHDAQREGYSKMGSAK